MKSLNKIIDQYSNHDFVDIFEIVKNLWIKVDFINFEKINWIILWDRIWINENLSIEKQRFTLAHELCHYILWEKWASIWMMWAIEYREKRADYFAMNLLLPNKALIAAYNEFENTPTIASMFWVPVKIVEKKLESLIK